MQEKQNGQGSQNNNLAINYTISSDGSQSTHDQPTLQQMVTQFDIELKRSELQLKLAQADHLLSVSFQSKINCVLSGMAEIRFALGMPQVDDSRESSSLNEKVAIKSIFADAEQQAVLRVKYAKLMDLYMKIVMQLDFKKEDQIQT